MNRVAAVNKHRELARKICRSEERGGRHDEGEC